LTIVAAIPHNRNLPLGTLDDLSLAAPDRRHQRPQGRLPDGVVAAAQLGVFPGVFDPKK
jgi:hypothetical protein